MCVLLCIDSVLNEKGNIFILYFIAQLSLGMVKNRKIFRKMSNYYYRFFGKYLFGVNSYIRYITDPICVYAQLIHII